VAVVVCGTGKVPSAASCLGSQRVDRLGPLMAPVGTRRARCPGWSVFCDERGGRAAGRRGAL